MATQYNGCSEEDHLADVTTLFEWSELTMGQGTTKHELEKLIADLNEAADKFGRIKEEEDQEDYRRTKMERMFAPPTENETVVVSKYLRNLKDICFSVGVENDVIAQYILHERHPGVSLAPISFNNKCRSCGNCNDVALPYVSRSPATSHPRS